MADELRERWDQRYRELADPPPPLAALAEYAYLLPTTGRALDLACGLGANALWLAARGLETWAWDISPVAIARLAAAAHAAGLTVRAEVRDVAARPPAPTGFDVIVVRHFLERSLAPALQAALRPGGVLIYQTFTKARLASAGGPQNPAFLLDDNELLKLFAGLKARAYRDENLLGDVSLGLRNEALLIAQKDLDS